MMGDHDCMICGDFLENGFILSCGHVFHYQCVEFTLKKPDPKCRICKLTVQSSDVAKLSKSFLKDCREINSERMFAVPILSEKMPDLFYFRPAFLDQKLYMTYEMNVTQAEHHRRLEQFVTIIQITSTGGYKIERRINWQKLRNDGSRLLAIAVCENSVYCCVRYSDDTFGIEKVVPSTLKTIGKHLNLEGLKFDLSQHGRMDASILGTGNRLLVLQKRSSKTIINICENGKLVAEREIVRKQNKANKQQQQSITRMYGDFLLMVDRNSSGLAFVQWKKGDEILDKFKVKEIEIPEKRLIKSFAMCQIESVPYMVLLHQDSKNTLEVYQFVADNDDVKIVLKQQVEVKEAKHMVCVFSTPQDGQLLTMDCVNLCCYQMIMKKEKRQDVHPTTECVFEAKKINEASGAGLGVLKVRLLTLDKEFQALECKFEELELVISIGYRPLIKRALSCVDNIAKMAITATEGSKGMTTNLRKIQNAVIEIEDICGFLKFQIPSGELQQGHGTLRASSEEKLVLSEFAMSHIKGTLDKIVLF